MATRRPTSPAPEVDESEALAELGLNIDDLDAEDNPFPEEEDPAAKGRPEHLDGENEAALGDVIMTTTDGKQIVPDDTWKPMIWMTMKGGSFPTITERGIQRLKMQPFCITPPLPRDYRAMLNKTVRAKGQYDYYPRYLWDLPPEEYDVPVRSSRGRMVQKRDAKGRLITDVKGAPVPMTVVAKDCGGMLTTGKPGSQMKTCPLANCPRHPRPQGIHHSVLQAQKYITTLKQNEVIESFIRLYDPRAEVVAFAQQAIRVRQKLLSASTGFGDGDRVGLVY